jgi:hypothetical protein
MRDCRGFIFPLRSNPDNTCWCDRCGQQIGRDLIEAKGVDYKKLQENVKLYKERVGKQ